MLLVGCCGRSDLVTDYYNDMRMICFSHLAQGWKRSRICSPQCSWLNKNSSAIRPIPSEISRIVAMPPTPPRGDRPVTTSHEPIRLTVLISVTTNVDTATWIS